MKIVNRQSFLQMPEGVVYCKFSPNVFGDLAIKGESLRQPARLPEHYDFYYQPLVEFNTDDHNETMEAMVKGESAALDLALQSRDGLFDAEQLFAVFEKEDVRELARRLNEALSDGYDAPI